MLPQSALPLKHLVIALLAGFLLAAPAGAAAKGPAVAKKAAPAAAPEDISTPARHLKASCPLPTQSLCAMANPTGESSWRILNKNVEAEITPSGWLVDFSKVWKEGTQKLTLRVMAGSGVLFEIEVGFHK